MVKQSFRNGYLLFFFIILSFVSSEIVILGNDYIATAADAMFVGEPIHFSTFIVPLLALVVLGTITTYFKSISGKHYSAAVQKEVRAFLGNHLVCLPFSYFDEKGTGNIMTRLISDMEELGRFFSEILPELLVNIITVLTATVYFVQMDPRLIIVLFASYPLMLLVTDFLSKKLAMLAQKLRVHMDERTELANDAIGGIVVGRSYNLYPLQKQKIDTVINNMVAQACKSTRISSLSWVLKNVITTIPVIVCYLFALYEVVNNRITIGELLAFAVLLGRILGPLGDIIFCANDFREIGVSLKRIQEIYRQPPERSDGSDYAPLSCDTDSYAITWDNVTFSYDKDQTRQVLNGVTFSLEAGAHIAFVGGSGEGKSTILKLLCGFYEKSGGEYKLFGHPFDQWTLQAARSCFSEVSQNVFLFPESIRQNVACGKEHATEEEIITACKNANIHDFIMQLPEQYDTLVGERGVRLSGGQRQRISIARAFLKNAPILLLDEPTAAIDIESEAKIQEALERITAHKTVITIAHRLFTVQNAQRIYVVSGGKIAESGSHRELLEQHGIYAELYGRELAENV